MSIRDASSVMDSVGRVGQPGEHRVDHQHDEQRPADADDEPDSARVGVDRFDVVASRLLAPGDHQRSRDSLPESAGSQTTLRVALGMTRAPGVGRALACRVYLRV